MAALSVHSFPCTTRNSPVKHLPAEEPSNAPPGKSGSFLSPVELTVKMVEAWADFAASGMNGATGAASITPSAITLFAVVPFPVE
jgi:hypothetical protein